MIEVTKKKEEDVVALLREMADAIERGQCASYVSLGIGTFTTGEPTRVSLEIDVEADDALMDAAAEVFSSG